jgi:hypothetical protein
LAVLSSLNLQKDLAVSLLVPIKAKDLLRVLARIVRHARLGQQRQEPPVLLERRWSLTYLQKKKAVRKRKRKGGARLVAPVPRQAAHAVRVKEKS